MPHGLHPVQKYRYGIFVQGVFVFVRFAPTIKSFNKNRRFNSRKNRAFSVKHWALLISAAAFIGLKSPQKAYGKSVPNIVKIANVIKNVFNIVKIGGKYKNYFK